MAAEIAVPLPLSRPVTDVVRVIAGVLVLVATVPAKPFAVTTDADVTVPVPPATVNEYAASHVPADEPLEITVAVNCDPAAID